MNSLAPTRRANPLRDLQTFGQSVWLDYIEELIGPDTVNTIPPATFDAFRKHGEPRQSLTENLDAARETMAALSRAGISMRSVTDRLLEDGVQLFVEAFESLLATIAERRRAAVAPATKLSEIGRTVRR